jgi:ribonuclease HI
MKIAEPLYKLIKKNNAYRWAEDQQQAFETLKKKLTEPPVLATPDPDPKNPFILITDACEKGYGAVLAQKQNGVEKPIAFYSRKVSEREQRLFKDRSFEHEFAALCAACNEFRYFLRGGAKFIVYTDNKAVAQMNKKSLYENPTYAKWYTALRDYDFDIKWREGRKLQNADALSRMFRMRTRNEIAKALDECHNSRIAGIGTLLKL